MSKPSISLLRSLFRYEHETGRLIWQPRDRNLTGREAGGVDPKTGYRRVKVEGRLQQAHQIIIAMRTGVWPEEVDHINGNRTDNRLCNLRPVTKAENMKNKAMYRSNRSGVVGVHWHKQHRKWCASLGNRTLGVFRNFDDAVAARAKAAEAASYHANHGRIQ